MRTSRGRLGMSEERQKWSFRFRVQEAVRPRVATSRGTQEGPPPVTHRKPVWCVRARPRGNTVPELARPAYGHVRAIPTAGGYSVS